jgi:hypothetical protein
MPQMSRSRPVPHPQQHPSPRSGGPLGSLLVLLLLLGGAFACTPSERESRVDGGEGGPESTEIIEVPPRPNVVDSIFPIEEELRRFREGMTQPQALTGGEESLEALVQRFVRALEAGDAETVATLGMTPAEFAWFYYPYTMYTTSPYELPPGLVWFQLQNLSSRGLTRALNRYAGKTLVDTGVECPDRGKGWGERGWILDDCRVVGALPDGTRVEERLFGSILRVDGRYKFVSFANDF